MKDEDLVFDDDGKRLNINFESNLHDFKYKYDKEDYVLASLLIWLKSFNKRIHIIRSRFGVKPIEYPKKSDLDSLLRLIYKGVKVEDYNDLTSEIEFVRDRYGLPENWLFSIRVAIFTNSLLVPISEVINTHVPEITPGQSARKIKDLRHLSSVLDDPALRRTQEALRLYKYPFLYFTRYTSAEELITWLKDKNNRKYFSYIQRNLPKKKIMRRMTNTLFWGQVVWIIKKEGIHSWVKIKERIEEICDDILENDGYEGNEDLEKTPTNIDLKNDYERFIASLKQIENVRS